MNAFLNKTIHRQGALLLNNARYAYILIVLFAGLPFMAWLSVAIVALITLRIGAEAGLKALGFGLMGLFLFTALTSSVNLSNTLIVLFTFVPCFLGAWLLRVSAKWEWVVLFLLGITSLFVCVFHFFTPAVLMAEYHALESVMQRMQTNGVPLSTMLADQSYMIAYLLGIQALSFMISTLSALMLARALQAKLFYPNGFKQEMLAFQILPLAAFPFLLIMLGLYWHHALALSLTPIWILYAASAGISVLICLFAPHRVLITLCLILIATALIPFILLPILIFIGLSDSLIHFRSRFTTTTTRPGKKKS